jgi:hypothetical protein
LYLDDKDLAAAWPYFRMLGEPGPVAAALERGQFRDEQFSQALEIALNEGVHPRRGFDLILERHGLCNAITTLAQSYGLTGEVRAYCIRRLVHAIHGELSDRLCSAIAQHEGHAPSADARLGELLEARDWLFADEMYHIDVSHLSSIIQFALELGPGEDAAIAAELCEYGLRLTPKLQYPGDPPFEGGYADYLLYFQTLLGKNEEDGLAHFRAKADAVAERGEGETAPAQVLVHLLGVRGRHREALAAYAWYLTHADPGRLACPGPVELAGKLGDFGPLAEISLRRGDLVNYVAAVLQDRAAGKG